ncbi:MAG: MFS transporter [Oscillospiraceae bacterium]|nr:MFS transporter [Oscillospiraceae bacterium]
MVYVIFYAGQAMYNTYLNLFLNDSGFNMSAIGLVQSAATLALVLVQPLWGVLSDKSKSKNRIISLLALVTALVCLSFYAFRAALWLAFCVMLFTVFFNPIITLQDNYTLEYLEGRKWDFGHIRLGGTLGYAICAMLVGFVIGTNYGQIFWMMSIFFLAVCACYMTLPQVEGHRQKHEKVKYSILLKDRPLRWMLVFNVIYYLGTAFYFQFYPLYFRNELGASTRLVGMLTFFSAMSEVPFFWFAHKLEKKFGVKRIMLFAGAATALRWFLLFFISEPVAVLFINMLSGCGYVGFSYCLIKYINDTVPKSMRATAQSLNAILGTIFSKILFAPLGGVLSDLLGIRVMLLTAGIVMLCGVTLFAIAFRPPQKELQK